MIDLCSVASSLLDLRVTPDADPPLDLLVRKALAQRLGRPLETVIAQPNRDKYHDPMKHDLVDARLHEIFALMRDLNRSAVEDQLLAATP